MKVSKYWYQVSPVDVRARLIADRHYSRQTPGAREFCRPGNKIVLLHFVEGKPVAVWASQRPDPSSGITRDDGLDAWDCSIFRNEGAKIKSSELIKEAVAITLGKWADILPVDGFITTVNPRKVRPIKQRGRLIWGYCFLKAGFRRIGETKVRQLGLLQLPLDELREIQPLAPMREQASFIFMRVQP